MINATINGFANKSNQAAFAVHITIDNKKHERIIPMKNTTANQAELAAVQYICQAVQYKHDQLAIITSSPYISKFFEFKDGKWCAEPQNNIELVNKIRLLLGRFKSFSISVDGNGEVIKALKEKVRAIY